ncbi:MAG: PadR family transcriptional regulator [Clostridia bacterium]|nr:PadR family transcriptional regulator [Clostridia bacterium]
MSQNQENFKRGCAEVLALYLLSKEDMYGYQITQLMEEKSGGRFTMLEGTLYLILYKLVDAGYIKSYTKLVGKKRTRKYYHLEDKGREYLDEILNEYDEITLGISLILDRNSHSKLRAIENNKVSND